MRTNILAYQDLLIEKETEIKAYAIQLSQALKSQGIADQTAIKNLKQIIEDQQTELETLRRIDHSQCPKTLTDAQLDLLIVEKILNIEKEY